MWWTHAAKAAHVLCFALLPLVGSSADGPSIQGETLPGGTPGLKNVNGVLMYRGVAFSGHVVERSGERLLSRTPYLNGKEHGLVEAWHPSGSLRHQKLYRSGHREGTHRGFWENGQVQFVYHYERDLFEGEQVAYYKNGVQSELRHYRDGHEEGQQRFYDGEGRLMANYTFKDGKRYGIVGRFDCISVVRH